MVRFLASLREAMGFTLLLGAAVSLGHAWEWGFINLDVNGGEACYMSLQQSTA